MAIERNGTYGTYYGSTFNESGTLTVDQTRVNAQYFRNAMTANGWSLNAICAMLGNMQAESGINPGRWQSDNVGNTSAGYGLVQWTPATKYIEWCGNNDPSEMDQNIARILYEVENGLQWIATSAYDLSFKEFSTSNKTVGYLAKSFLLNYERPADQSASVQALRSSYAESWYTYLTGTAPDVDPDAPATNKTKKRKGYNFVLFNRKRRMQQWIGKNF